MFKRPLAGSRLRRFISTQIAGMIRLRIWKAFAPSFWMTKRGRTSSTCWKNTWGPHPSGASWNGFAREGSVRRVKAGDPL